MTRTLFDRLIGLAIAFLVAFCAGCYPSRSASSPNRVPTTGTSTNLPRQFVVNGVMKELDLSKRKVRITHDDIPGYMAKMTMLFDVRDQSDLGRLKPGDAVTFRMFVTADDGWIEQLAAIRAPSDGLAASGSVQSTNAVGTLLRVADVDPLFPGDAVPDYAFTNEFGKAIRLSEYRGQAVALTFIFTTCPFPTMCPRMSNHLRDAYRSLTSDVGAPTNWHFLSITIDPAVDTPEVLKRYANRYQYDPIHWSFVTGAAGDIEALGRQFGLQYFREKGALNHNLRTVVVDPNGKVHKTLIGNEWKPEELVDEVRGALSKSASPSSP